MPDDYRHVPIGDNEGIRPVGCVFVQSRKVHYQSFLTFCFSLRFSSPYPFQTLRAILADEYAHKKLDYEHYRQHNYTNYPNKSYTIFYPIFPIYGQYASRRPDT